MTENDPKLKPSIEPPDEWVESFKGQFVSKVTTKEIKSAELTTTETTTERVPKAVEALKYAHDIRKFEIELYWKRSAYFQTVIGIVLGALALTLRGGDSSQTSAWTIPPQVLQAVVTFFGAVLSFAWYAVTRGGKYWQRNWETQVDALENLITGPLYKTVYRKKAGYAFGKLLVEFPYSTSKINSLIALAFLILFLSVQIVLAIAASEWRIALFVSFVLSLIAVWLMHRFTKFDAESADSGFGRSYEIELVPTKRQFVQRSRVQEEE